MASSASTLFNCTACLEDKPAKESVSVAGDLVCPECFDEGIKPLLDNALKNQAKYPVKWGGVELKPKDFSHFDAAYLARWEEKEIEYKPPVDTRVYCAGTQKTGCGEFLGSKVHLKDNNMVTCRKCDGKTCVKCGSTGEFFDAHHTCPTNATTADPLEGLVKSKDYQICPGCHQPISLRDGCNALTCPCGTSFCFICGEEAEHMSLHWQVGSACPRYNHPDAANAHHDADDWLADEPDDANDVEPLDLTELLNPANWIDNPLNAANAHQAAPAEFVNFLNGLGFDEQLNAIQPNATNAPHDPAGIPNGLNPRFHNQPSTANAHHNPTEFGFVVGFEPALPVLMYQDGVIFVMDQEVEDDDGVEEDNDDDRMADDDEMEDNDDDVVTEREIVLGDPATNFVQPVRILNPRQPVNVNALITFIHIVRGVHVDPISFVAALDRAEIPIHLGAPPAFIMGEVMLPH